MKNIRIFLIGASQLEEGGEKIEDIREIQIKDDQRAKDLYETTYQVLSLGKGES